MRNSIVGLSIVGMLLGGGAISAHAQYLTGGTPAAAALKGCLILNAVPSLNNGAPGSCSNAGGQPGQLAGSVWVAKINGDGSIASGSDWINSVAYTGMTNNIFNYVVSFKGPFVKPPVCVASPWGTGNISPAGTGNTDAAGTAVTSSALGASAPPAGGRFALMCSIGQ